MFKRTTRTIRATTRLNHDETLLAPIARALTSNHSETLLAPIARALTSNHNETLLAPAVGGARG